MEGRQTDRQAVREKRGGERERGGGGGGMKQRASTRLAAGTHTREKDTRQQHVQAHIFRSGWVLGRVSSERHKRPPKDTPTLKHVQHTTNTHTPVRRRPAAAPPSHTRPSDPTRTAGTRASEEKKEREQEQKETVTTTWSPLFRHDTGVPTKECPRTTMDATHVHIQK